MKANLVMCLIVKNESPRLEACIKSFRDYVRAVVIVDTGSNDGSQEIAKQYADVFEVFTDCNDPETGLMEDFAMARQRSFDIAAEKYPDCFIGWQDGDDTMEGAEKLPELISFWEKQRNDKPCMITVPYLYAKDSAGNPIVRQYRERFIYPSSGFNWRNSVHEVLVPSDPVNTINPILEDIIYHHHRGDKVIEPFRNLRILKKMYDRMGESDARHLYYLGLEYGNANDAPNMIKFLNRYLELSGWDDECAMACFRLAQHYLGIGDYKQAIDAGLKAISFKEDWGEPYFFIAKACYYLAQAGKDVNRNWQRCAKFARQGLSYPPTRTLLFVNPLDREYEIHKYLNVALCNTGDIQGALDSVNIALAKIPGDPSLLCNKGIYEKHLARNTINEKLNSMLNSNILPRQSYDAMMHLLDGKTPDGIVMNTAPTVINNTINGLEAAKDAVAAGKYVLNSFMRVEVAEPPMGYPKLDVVFAIGNGLEVYTPETVKKTGIGGSELLSIHMAAYLAKLGHKVRYYGGCDSSCEGFYDGVEYHKFEDYNNLDCDVLVVSRNATFLDKQFNIKAKLKLLWCHDMVIVNPLHKYILEADRILALTKWHKGNLMREHNLHPDQVIVTRNGIDVNRFKNKNIKRDQFKCINSSSPDRSWAVLLEVFPEIRKQVPGATLHLLYGMDNWLKCAPGRPPGEMETIKRLQDKIESLKDQGVVYRGRVSQEEVANEMLSAGVLLFPSWFQETSYIGGMESQAAGLHIITTGQAAVLETVGDRGDLIEGEWTSPEYQAKFIEKAVAALKNNDETKRERLHKYAEEHFSLDSLALEWEKMFYDLIEQKQTNPIMPYQPIEEYKNR